MNCIFRGKFCQILSRIVTDESAHNCDDVGMKYASAVKNGGSDQFYKRGKKEIASTA
jgi:hypothetical protein